MAAALRAGIPFGTFTFLYDGMKLADRKLPPELAKRADVAHIAVTPQDIDPEKLALFDRHACHNFMDRDREFYARAYWRFCNPGDLVLKGHCFEIARCHFWKKLRDVSSPNGKSIAEAFDEDSNGAADALDEWLEWVDCHPIANLDWKDRFYHEQRLAGWCSADMQANDLIDIEFLVPANASSIMSLLLSVGENTRVVGQHQLHLIERMAPQLLELPVNQTTNFNSLTRLYWHCRYGTLIEVMNLRAARAFRSMRSGRKPNR